MRRAVLVVNPFASQVTDERVEAVRAELERGASVETLFTERPGHAVELVEAVTDADAIFVFSGDGGFNEALNGADGSVPVGRANGRRFGFSCGVGLDAEVVRRVDALGRRSDGARPGDLAFARVVGGVLLERRGRLDPALEVRGLGRGAFAILANGDPYTYAGSLPLHAAPLARLEEGLDLVAPVRLRPAVIARIVGHLLRGRGLERARGVLYAHDLDRVEILCDRPLPLHVDGEDLGDVERLEAVCERNAVAVLV